MIKIRDVTWTSTAELKLPAWLKTADWKSGYEMLWLGAPCSESNVLSDLTTIRSLKASRIERPSRQCFYIPYDAVGSTQSLAQELLDIFGVEMPLMHPGSKPRFLSKKFNKPALAITIDLVPEVSEFRNTTILIPHWESVGFLRLCIESIMKIFESNNRPKVLIIDDHSQDLVWNEVQELGYRFGIDTIQVARNDQKKVADVGKLLDAALLQVETEYVCMLDADTMILSEKFLSDPLNFLESRSNVSVGLDTNLSASYHSNRMWNRYGAFDTRVISLPNYFSVTNNLYRVMRTLDAKAVSLAEPFSRNVAERKLRDQFGRALRKLDSNFLSKTKFNGLSRELLKVRILNSRWPAMPPTSDNGVNANFWMDANNLGYKINIPITSYGMLTPRDGVCFQNISELLIHIALSTRALSQERREIDNAGEEFYEAIKDIASNEFEYSEISKRVFEISRKHKN